MADAICPIAYDHNDDLDECMVCGWTLEAELAPIEVSGPKDMSTMTGPERIREAIGRLSGAYAPTGRVLICAPEK